MSGARPRTILAPRLGVTLGLGLTASVRILAYDAAGLRRFLEERAAENPALLVQPAEPAPGDWTPRWRTAFARTAALPPRGGEAAAGSGSLAAHVEAALAAMFPAGPERRVAEALALALEPTGWLGRPLAEVAAETGMPPAQVEQVLRRLQDIEPAGLFARNLAECLTLQAREAGWLDRPMAVLLDRLDLVAQGAAGRLARLAAVDEAAVRVALGRLRSLDPKPGLLFDPACAPVREPDLIVRREAGGWQVALNRSALPALSVAPLPRRGAAPLLRAQTAEARSLLRQVEARGRTLQAVAAEVLRRQSAALEHGQEALVPLTMAAVAKTLGMHESTVSRAVAGTSVDTPGGTWWLRALFSAGLGAGGALAGSALRHRLSALVAAEDRRKPLSDAALAEALDPEGGIARRTVAKYRAMTGIPPAHARRRR
jgi:RNA polymerase sigma-54 factor